jgi:hypothetical protein
MRHHHERHIVQIAAGKVGIPDAVLLKPGPLTPPEYELIKQHTIIGDRLCGELRSLRSVRPIVSSTINTEAICRWLPRGVSALPQRARRRAAGARSASVAGSADIRRTGVRPQSSRDRHPFPVRASARC